jgi:hypothetical protein
VPAEFCDELARLLQKDGRLDQWAQQIYRQASMPPPARIDPTRIQIEEAAALDIKDLKTIDEIHPDESFRMSSEAAELDEEEEEGGRPDLLAEGERRRVFMRGLQDIALTAGQTAIDGLQRLARAGHAAVDGITRWKHARLVLAGALIAGMASGGLWIAVHTTGDPPRVPDSPPAVEPAALAPPAETDPYTLQVAAYLKQEYALKLVQDLKTKGLDAYYTETTSSGQRWYQVRISHFADQQSAREFGRNLKWKGLIDDFYVTNYVR